MRKFLAATTILLGMSGYAAAADMAVSEPAPVIAAPIFSWTGGYVGIQGGYTWADSHFEDNLGAFSSDSDPEGWLLGGYVGYNWQMPSNVVLGIEGDIAWSDADGDDPFAGTGVFVGGLAGNSEEINWTGAIRGRLGYAMDRFLPYIAGGVSFADVSTTSFDVAGVAFNDDSDTVAGWTLGAGAEYAFTDHFTVRAEYRYTDFSDIDVALEGTGLDFGSQDLTTNEIRVGAAWKW